MALIEGCSLARQLAERRMSLNQAVEIIAELAGASAYAHSQGVVHRDVKPANIRVDDQGTVYRWTLESPIGLIQAKFLCLLG